MLWMRCIGNDVLDPVTSDLWRGTVVLQSIAKKLSSGIHKVVMHTKDGRHGAA